MRRKVSERPFSVAGRHHPSTGSKGYDRHLETIDYVSGGNQKGSSRSVSLTIGHGIGGGDPTVTREVAESGRLHRGMSFRTLL